MPDPVAAVILGAVFTLAAAEYPIEITRVRIGWGSQFGGAPQSLEEAIRLYPAGLPNPSAPQFSGAGPVLTDGVINEFDLSLFPGDRVIQSGPFTLTLVFLNTNAGDFFAPCIVHDGNGCSSGQNVIFAIPGGWANACSLGVTGDWLFGVLYRRLPGATPSNGSAVNPMTLSASSGPVPGSPWPVNLDCSAHAHGGGSTTFVNTPSLDLAFCGFELAAQGLCLGDPNPQFSNMLSVRAGS